MMLLRPLVYWTFFLAILSACHSDRRSGHESNAVKYQQYLHQGELLYEAHCLNCHQKDGTGLGQLIPPLYGEFIAANKSLSICGIKHGLEGQVNVNGIVFDGTMPANPRLTTLEIAEIMTYICNSWGNDLGMISIPEVEKALMNCSD